MSGAAAAWSAAAVVWCSPARARSWSPTRSGRGGRGCSCAARSPGRPPRRVYARRCACPLPAPLRRRLSGDSRGGRHAAFAPRLRRLGARWALCIHTSAPARGRGRAAACGGRIGDRLGRNARQAGVFASDGHGTSALMWSANGSRLLYESRVRAPRDLWAVAADGSNLHRLTHAGPDASAPAWSADGMRLAYTLAPFTGGLCGFCLGSVVLAGQTAARNRRSPVPLPVRRRMTAARRGRRRATASWWASAARASSMQSAATAMRASGSSRAPRARSRASACGLRTAPRSPRSARAAVSTRRTGRHRDRVLLAGSGNDQATAVAWSHDSKLVGYSAPDGVHVVPADGSTPPRLIAPPSPPAA